MMPSFVVFYYVERLERELDDGDYLMKLLFSQKLNEFSESVQPPSIKTSE
jgi:hypothetical protein